MITVVYVDSDSRTALEVCLLCCRQERRRCCDSRRPRPAPERQARNDPVTAVTRPRHFTQSTIGFLPSHPCTMPEDAENGQGRGRGDEIPGME